MIQTTNNILTEKQKLFCQELLIDENQTRAAIRAGYSKKAAHVQASKMLNLPKISEYIAELREARAARIQAQSDINAKWVLDRSIELHQKCIEENNLPTAKGVLELIGKNVSVNAFNKDSTDISFNLKEIKVIYGKLESRNISPAKT